MSLIQETGYYKGKIVDAGLNESSGGFPQENLSLVAEEIYDEATGEYMPADPESNQITAYEILFDSRDRETLNCKQLKKITGWDGASFVELANMNLADVPIQFRVESHTYQENTTLQVTWIDPPGASPVRSIQKLDETGVKALHIKYAGLLASTKAPVKPVSAPTSAPKPTTAHTTIAGINNAPAAAPPTYPAPAAASAKPKRGRPVGKPKAPAPVGKCTADQAWVEVSSLKRDNIDENKLSEIWVETIHEKVGDVAEENITEEQWFLIKQAILVKVSKV